MATIVNRSAFISAVAGVMAETRMYLDGLELIPRRLDSDIVLLMLFSKSIRVTEAIVCLVSNGFDDEAFGLCRTALEIELTLRYLTNKDSLARCRRFLYFFAKDKTEWSRLIKKYYPNMQPRRVNVEVYEELAAAYRSPHKWSEHPDGVKGFAAEASLLDTFEDGSPSTQEFYYEVLYKWMSQYAHATVSGIEQEHTTEPGEIFKVHRRQGLSTKWDGALMTSLLSVHLNLIRVFRNFNMTVPYTITAAYESAVTIGQQNTVSTS